MSWSVLRNIIYNNLPLIRRQVVERHLSYEKKTNVTIKKTKFESKFGNSKFKFEKTKYNINTSETNINTSAPSRLAGFFRAIFNGIDLILRGRNRFQRNDETQRVKNQKHVVNKLIIMARRIANWSLNLR